MKDEITLLYDPDCPNVELARKNIRQALTELSLPANWREADISDPRTPRDLKMSGSPTILVNGVDVAGASRDSQAACCRLYTSEDGKLVRAPSADAIVHAIEAGRGKRSTRRRLSGFWHGLTSLPGALAALLPVTVCPLCLPAFLGFLSAIGLGFLLQARFLLPLIVGLLILALTGLAYKAHRRRGYGPLTVGVAASVVILMGKFLLNFEPAIYFGVALLIGASIWNAWPRRADRTSPCSSCVPTDKSELTRDAQN